MLTLSEVARTLNSNPIRSRQCFRPAQHEPRILGRFKLEHVLPLDRQYIVPYRSNTFFEPREISIVQSPKEIGEIAARKIIQVANNAKSSGKEAIIVLPTGSTPIPMYKKLVEEYKKGNVDFSKVRFFNLDEYVGLEKDHPLSYSFYMKTVFYNELEKFDPSRKPLEWSIPEISLEEKDFTNGKLNSDGEKKVELAVNTYERKYNQALEKNGSKADLAVLGIGGAYPEDDIFKGGHIGFNEPGTVSPDFINDRTKHVTLSKKTLGDTRYRFRNVKYLQDAGLLNPDFSSEVPKTAITLGVGNILESREILLLANGEEKAPVIKELYYKNPSDDFPATYLKYHPNVRWIIDIDAASEIPESKTPWNSRNENFEWSETTIRQAAFRVLKESDELRIKDLNVEHLQNIGIDEKTTHFLGNDGAYLMESIRESIGSSLTNRLYSNERIHSEFNGKKVLIFSPHPDDDVICAGATIKKLIAAGAEVHIAYSTNGEIAVRDKDAEANFNLIPENKTLTGFEAEKAWALAKRKVRQEEATQAATMLGADKKNITFLNQDCYYRRGFLDLDPISESDIQKVSNLLDSMKPDFVFYSAEHDSHGTHGHSTETIKRGFKNLKAQVPSSSESHWSDNTKFLGYRGAYNEWPLHEAPERLMIVDYDISLLTEKERSIKTHKSQLNPMYPSFDRREFFERSRDRNTETGRLLFQLGLTINNYAEVFFVRNREEFLNA